MHILASAPMQFLHYLLLYCALIFADQPLQKLLAWFYLYPMTILFVLIKYTSLKSLYGGTAHKWVKKLAFLYSCLAIATILCLFIFNQLAVWPLPVASPFQPFSFYDILIIAALMTGFSFAAIIHNFEGLPSNVSPESGIPIFIMVFSWFLAAYCDKGAFKDAEDQFITTSLLYFLIAFLVFLHYFVHDDPKDRH